ncbi:MAG: hypothetical protein IKK70_01565 [Clostridia bacterium]|nr:hypothetical protein [Clostridia bacterium]
MSTENNNLPAESKPNAVTTRRIKKQETKSQRLVRMAKRFFAQFGTAIIAVALVAYVFLQLMLNVSVSLDRETATYASITERAELEAFLFRDEFLIPEGASGTDCFLAEDGEKVRYGEDIVVTYSNPSDVEIQKRISEIDKRIDILERSSLSTGASTTDIALIDEEIDELVLSIIRQVDTNDFDKVIREKEELLILMNRRQSLIESESYGAELSALTNERKQLNERLSGESVITQSPKSGYFYSTVDGYEAAFTLDKLETLTGEEFEALSDATPNQSLISSSSGKIVLSSTWYIAVALDKRTAESFRDGTSYPITFQYSNNTELNMKLERRITRTDKDMTVLVFSTKQMPEGFDYSRCQTVELSTVTHEGIRISNSALRVKDGVTGVYTVVGSKVVFKKTTVLYNYGSYSICKIPVNPAYPNRKDVAYSSSTELSLHDSVIIDGDEIYDGMRLK